MKKIGLTYRFQPWHAFAALVAVSIVTYAAVNRYQVKTLTKGYYLKVDRWTGATDSCRIRGKDDGSVYEICTEN